MRPPRSNRAAALLALFQVARFGAIRFFAMAVDGRISWAFALPVGLGDLAIAATAPVVAWFLLFRPGEGARRWAVRWNGLGILDLLIALPLGVLTGFPLEAPMTGPMPVDAPMAVIPFLAVPACIALHVVGIVLVRRR